MMAAYKVIILVIVTFSVLCKYVPTEATDILNRITGLFNPHRDHPQVDPGFSPHHYPGSPSYPGHMGYIPRNQPPSYPSFDRNYGQHPPTPGYSAGQNPYNPNYPAGQGSYNPNYPSGQDFNYPGGNRGYVPSGSTYNPSYPSGQGSVNPNYPSGQDPNYPGYNRVYGPSSPTYPKEENSNHLGTGTQQGSFNHETPVTSDAYNGGQGPRPSTTAGTGPADNNVGNSHDLTNYEVDVRNGNTGVVNTTTPDPFQDPQARSLLAFKGCPDGERRDRAGKCRPVT